MTAHDLLVLERQLIPTSNDILYYLIANLRRHYQEVAGCAETGVRKLAAYPEDLICAAYMHFIKSMPVSYDGMLQSMAHFMDPEFNHRKQCYQRLLNSLERE